MGDSIWPVVVKLAEVDRKDQLLRVTADEAVRARICKLLDLSSLDRFEATVRLTSWLDGAIVRGEWSADLAQTCGITLEPLPAELSGVFELKVLQKDSPNAPLDDPDAVIDPEADDPPDLLETDDVPVGDFLIEHLALELDPFPRKPGVVFEQPDPPGVISPFAALKDFKPRSGDKDR